jgi:glycosyltransferase involved in cell wall biosynthesis
MPKVTIVVPCYNEQATIHLLLESLYHQTYDRTDTEVIIADGMSTDDTRQKIKNFKQDHPDLEIEVVDNLNRNIPSGLNRAIQAARGKYIIRLDAHSIPAKDYVERSIHGLEAGLGDNIGGVWEIKSGNESWQARSIALAASHPLGVGDAHYRIGGKPKAVDTVPFGAFHKSLIDEIGPFDETLLANEDYEFNTRIRKSGGRVWLDPQIRSIYIARAKYSELAKQYWRYGYWKARMLARYPETFRWRQLAGVFVLSWFVLGTLAIPFLIARWFLLIQTVVYGFGLVGSGVQLAVKHRDIALILGSPIAIATMHFSWGFAFLWSLVETGLRMLFR